MSVIVKYMSKPSRCYIGMYHIHCAKCGAEVSFFWRKAADRTQAKVIEAWNRREHA